MQRRFFRPASLALAVALFGATGAAQEVQVSDTARQHFKTGVAYLTDPDGARYEEAYREFKAAYADSPSWKILGNLGITAMKLERDGEAIEAFTKYLEGGKDQIDPAERAQMERDTMTTKAGVVYVTLKVDPPTAMIVDERQPLTGRVVDNRYELPPDGVLKIGIRRGHHRITAKLSGYTDSVWEFDAEPGADQAHDFKLEKPVAPPPATAGAATGAAGQPAPEMKRPITTPIFIGAAATGALLIGSGVVGVMALSKNSDYKKVNDGQHYSEAKDLRNSGQTLNLVGDVLLAGGVVAGVVTTILFINRPTVAADGAPPQKDTGKLDFVPVVGSTGGGMFMTGKF
jgi:hypothetical protein